MNSDDADYLDDEYLDSVFNDLGRTDSKYGHPDNQKRIREFYPGSNYASIARLVDEAMANPEKFGITERDGEP